MEKSNQKTDEITFYRCDICHNIIFKICDSGITPQCCARSMTKLIPGDSDGDVEKHLPSWSVDGNKIHIEIGSKHHPMSEEHYIQWIFLKTDKGFHCKYLTPSDHPTACFTLTNGEIAQSIYSYCNIHGLWRTSIDEAMMENQAICADHCR